MNSKGCILITGGAGYIGSHVTLDLLDHGWRVVVLDNLATGAREMVPAAATFIHGDAGNTELVTQLLVKYRCDAVMHFAGSTVVPDSITDPLKYYLNNTAISRALLAACCNAGIERFIFSSTAAIYGNPLTLPITEETPAQPITPYGTSKLMTELMLRDVAAASPLRYVALRYFNVAGADPHGRAGQCTPGATHLIKVACEVAVGKRHSLTVHGDDYDTPDGTCIRDFIHVTDLASAHVKALDYLMAGRPSQTLNCGYGQGISVREIADTVQRLSHRPITVNIGPRRPGDIVACIAESSRIRHVLGWRPHFDNVEEIVGSALAWEQRQNASWRRERAPVKVTQ